MSPLWPSAARLALRKKTLWKYGTEKDTTASRIVATRVVMKPGVAGFIMAMVLMSCPSRYQGRREERMEEAVHGFYIITRLRPFEYYTAWPQLYVIFTRP